MPDNREQPKRPRFARVLSPGEDSSPTDLQLTLVFRLMFLAIFAIQMLTAVTSFWRLVAGAGTLIWVFLVLDAFRRLRDR